MPTYGPPNMERAFAAQPLRSSYCSLAHGKVLRDDCGAPLADIVRDRSTAGLDALGVLPDASLRDDFTQDELELLVVGRPIEDAV